MSKGKFFEEFSRKTSAHSIPFKSVEKALEDYNKSITNYLRKNYEINRRCAEEKKDDI